MGWFKDWLMQQSNDNPVEVQPSQSWQAPYPAPPTPPETRRVREGAPPMPACKAPKSDISEPVRTLINELKKDVWEVVERCEYRTAWIELIHVYKEDVKLTISCNRAGYLDYSVVYGILVDWMTELEKLTVNLYVTEIIKGINVLKEKARKEGSRKDFAKRLGVQNV